jgi:chorismate mutase
MRSEDVDAVGGIVDAQNRIVAEVNRRRSLSQRIAALKADDDPDRLLPEDTRPRTAAVAETSKRYPYNRRGWRQL